MSKGFSVKLNTLFVGKSTPEVFLGVTLVDGERSAAGKHPNAEHDWENVWDPRPRLLKHNTGLGALDACCIPSEDRYDNQEGCLPNRCHKNAGTHAQNLKLNLASKKTNQNHQAGQKVNEVSYEANYKNILKVVIGVVRGYVWLNTELLCLK